MKAPPTKEKNQRVRHVTLRVVAPTQPTDQLANRPTDPPTD